MAAPTADLRTIRNMSNEGKMPRRSMGFWCQFNSWYRTFWEVEGRRPSVAEVKRWYEEAADSCWGNMKPTWDETRTHSKCLRSLNQVRSYFRQYRAAKKETSEVRRFEASRPACGHTGTLQRALELESASLEGDASTDLTFYRAAKLRRPSTNGDAPGGSKSSSHHQEYAGFPGFLGTSGPSFALTRAAPGLPSAGLGYDPDCGTTMRTISTGIISRVPGYHSVTGMMTVRPASHATCSHAYRAAEDTDTRPQGTSAAHVPSGLWPLQQPDAPFFITQQKPAHSCEQHHHQVPFHSAGTPPDTAASSPCAVTPLAYSTLHPCAATALAGSPQCTDQPPHPLRQSYAAPGVAPNVQLGAGHPFPAAVKHEYSSMSPTLGPACGAPSEALVAGHTGEQQQPTTRLMAVPARTFAVTTGAGQQVRQQQQPTTTAAPPAKTQSAPMAVPAVGFASYTQPHLHHPHAHHPRMHMGYDPVYGQPSYMDPYAYCYGMYDPSMAYWLLCPNCCTAAPRTLYPELPPQALHYQKPAYGAAYSHTAAMPQCAQQQSVLSQVQQQATMCASHIPAVAAQHHEGLPRQSAKFSEVAFEPHRCYSALPLPQLDAGALVGLGSPRVAEDGPGRPQSHSCVPVSVLQQHSPPSEALGAHGPLRSVDSTTAQPAIAATLTPPPAALAEHLKQVFGRCATETPAGWKAGLDVLAPALTPGESLLQNSLDVLTLPDLLRADFDIDCELLLTSSLIAAMTGGTCGSSL